MTRLNHPGGPPYGTRAPSRLPQLIAGAAGVALVLAAVASTQALGGRDLTGAVTMEVVQGQMVLRSTQGSLTLVSSGSGILVSDVAGDMARLGLRSGDMIVAVRGRAARVPEDLVSELRAAGDQERIAVRLIRNGQQRTIDIRRADWAGALPPEPPTPPPTPGTRP